MKKTLLFLFALFCSMGLSAQWGTSPSVNTLVGGATGQQAVPKVSTQANGDTYISWFSPENGNYNVRLQRYDVFGERQWDSEGLLISDNESMSWITDYSMATGPDNRTYLAFQDIRNGFNNIYIYKISPTGQFNWGEDGIALSDNEDFEADPRICFTDAGNIVSAWSRDGESAVIVLKKLSPDGEFLWDEDVILEDFTGMSYSRVWLETTDDDAVMVFYSAYTPPNSQNVMLYVQKVLSDGSLAWDQPVAVVNTSVLKSYHQIETAPGPDGGVFAAWMDARAGTVFKSFVQYIDADGNMKYEQNGLEISVVSTYMLMYPYIAWDENEEMLYAFSNSSSFSQSYKGVAGQKIDFETGTRQWTDEGIEYYMLDQAGKSLNQIRLADDGNVLAVCTDMEWYPANQNETVFAFAAKPDGDFAWESERLYVSSVESGKDDVQAAMGHDNQIIVCWADDRNDDADIYAQNLQYDGSLGPITDLSVLASAEPGQICLGETSQLYAEASGGTSVYSYSWTSIPEGFVSSEQNPQVQPNESTLYLVDVDDGEDVRSAQVEVSVIDAPGDVGAISGATEVCQGGANEVYSVEPVTYATQYQWILPPGFEFASASTTTPSITLIVHDDAQSGEITVKAMNACGEGGMSILNIVVNGKPEIFAGMDVDLCTGECDTLIATGGQSYAWSNGVLNAVNIICPETTTDYIVTGRDENGCSNKDTVEVRVHGKPEMPIISGPEDVLNDQEYSYSVVFHETAEWNWMSGAGEILNGQGTNEIAIKWLNAGSDQILCYELSEFGCKSDTAYFDVAIGGVGVDEFAASLRIFPNPFIDEISIEITNTSIPREILITDLTGKQWPVSMNLDGRKVHLEMLETTMPSGLYFLQIQFDDGLITRKVVRK